MRAMVGLALNGWLFGGPVVLMTWAALRLLHRAPARVRYVLAIVAFLAATAMPLIPRDAHLAVAEGSAVETVADAIAFPLTMLWAIGAAVLLTRETIGHLRLRGFREEAPAELRRWLDWPARIPLGVSDHTPPQTIGLLAPRVVLPRDIAATFPPAVVRRIARHELAHCRWRDPFVYALLRIVASVFWLWPVWPLLRWARREREVAADEFALRSASGDEESYVAALLQLAHAHRSPAPAMAANDLEFRARRILGMPGRSSVALSVAVLTLASTLIAIAQPVRAEPDEPIVAIRIVKEIQ